MLMLIEVLLAMAISMVVFAGSVANVMLVKAVDNLQTAKARVRQVSTAVAAEQVCLATPGCTPSPALMATIPALGSVKQFGYLYSMSVSGSTWTYTAVPIADGATGLGSVYVDQTGVVRCSLPNQPVSVASPPCS